MAREVQEILQRYKDLQDIIAILGMDELSEEDKLTVARARRDPAASSPSPSSWPSRSPARPGRYVELEDTIARLQGDRRGQARRPARAGLLHGRRHRRGARERREDEGEAVAVALHLEIVTPKGAWSPSTPRRWSSPASWASSACWTATSPSSRPCGRGSSATRTSGSQLKRLAIGTGFAEVGAGDKVLVLTDSCALARRGGPGADRAGASRTPRPSSRSGRASCRRAPGAAGPRRVGPGTARPAWKARLVRNPAVAGAEDSACYSMYWARVAHHRPPLV